mgnify:CR=1 FL=1
MNNREKMLTRETLELLRETLRKAPDFRGKDWRTVDDWLFSELSFTKGELRDIYAGSGFLYDSSSAVPDDEFWLTPYLDCQLRCARNSGSDNIYGPGAEVYAMVDGMPTLFSSKDIPRISKYIGQTPRLERNRWNGVISLWFGCEKVWSSQEENLDDFMRPTAS